MTYKAAVLWHFYFQHVFSQALARLYVHTLFPVSYTEVLIDTNTHIGQGASLYLSSTFLWPVFSMLYTRHVFFTKNEQNDTHNGFFRRQNRPCRESSPGRSRIQCNAGIPMSPSRPSPSRKPSQKKTSRTDIAQHANRGYSTITPSTPTPTYTTPLLALHSSTPLPNSSQLNPSPTNLIVTPNLSTSRFGRSSSKNNMSS